MHAGWCRRAAAHTAPEVGEGSASEGAVHCRPRVIAPDAAALSGRGLPAALHRYVRMEQEQLVGLALPNMGSWEAFGLQPKWSPVRLQ